MARPSRRPKPRRKSQPAGPGRGSDPPGRTERRPSAKATLPPRLLGGLLIGLLAFSLYLPGFRNGFAYDAETVVAADPRIQNLDQPARLLASAYWPFGEENLALYRPLVTLSFAVDWAVHRGAPWGFHQTNALAHALASVLVFLLLAGLASTPAALAGAALFAVHPVHVEAVAGIVGRADIFAAGFSFAALMAWSRLPPRGAAILVTVPLLFLLALGSKESALMLPALLVLFDAATGKLRRTHRREWFRERAGLLVALALVAPLYMAARYTVLGVLAPRSLNPIMVEDSGLATRLRTALQIWPQILRLMVVPKVLLADYSPRVIMPAERWTPGALGGLAILVLSVAGGLYALARGRGRGGLALLWAPLALFTVSNLLVPIGVLLAERNLYVAVFALSLAVAAFLDTLGTRGKRVLPAALAVTAVVCALFAVRTVSRLPAWRTTDEVFRALLRDRPDSYRAQWHHARMAWRDSDLEAAAAYYRSALELWPYGRPVYLEAGMFATETGRGPDARLFAEEALEHWPDDPVFLRRMAVACLNLGDTTAARDAVERGLRVEPGDPLLTMMRETLGGSRSPEGASPR